MIRTGVILAVICSVMGSVANAATLRAGTVNGQAGQTVEVPIYLDDFTDPVVTLSLQGFLTYDDSILTLDSIIAGAAASAPNLFYSIQHVPGNPSGLVLDAFFDPPTVIAAEVLARRIQRCGRCIDRRVGDGLLKRHTVR